MPRDRWCFQRLPSSPPTNAWTTECTLSTSLVYSLLTPNELAPLLPPPLLRNLPLLLARHCRFQARSLSPNYCGLNLLFSISFLFVLFIKHSFICGRYPHALSADAFSKITKDAPGSDMCDAEVWEASRYLKETLVPLFVQKLDLLVC